MKQTVIVSLTLPYYGIIEGYSNWYVSTILLFYIMYPIAFCVLKKLPIVTFITISLLISVIQFRGYMAYDISISRIPVFLMGILLYQYNDDKRMLALLMLMTMVFWNMSIGYGLSRFLQTAFLMPLILFMVGGLCSTPFCIPNKATVVLTYLGTYSYELFLSNHFTKLTLEYCNANANYNVFQNVISYIILTFLYGYISIIISKFIKKIIY